MTTLRVRLKFQITDEFNEGLLFEDWLPSKADAVITRFGALQVEVWVDPGSFQIGPFREDPDQLAGAGDVRVGMIGMDIVIPDASDSLTEFVLVHANDDFNLRRASEVSLQNAYEDLGRIVMSTSVETLNRILAFFRVIKGQFWVPQLYFDPDDMAGFCASTSAVVRSDTWDWVRWKPSLFGVIKTELVDWKWRKVRLNDWRQLDQVLSAYEKPSLVLELLAASERLERDGRTRVALVEAVAALEVAVRRFLAVWRPNTKNVLLADLEVSSLDALYEKLGLRRTLAVLLPLLLSDKELPRDLLRNSISAVELRGVVVHRGKRNVERGELRPRLEALRALSMTLIELTRTAREP